MAPELMTVKNNPNITNWNFEDGYQKTTSTIRDYPNRIFNAKQFAGFYSVLQLFIYDMQYVCDLFDGFKLTLTTPGETRKSTTYYFQIILSEQTEIFIKPKLITTSKSLRRYSPNQRQCFFNSERQLHFYRIYTQNNCELECVSNFTKLECGCVKFSMPRKNQT